MNTPINDGGPAFPMPQHHDSVDGVQRCFAAGMSLRDYFASNILKAIVEPAMASTHTLVSAVVGRKDFEILCAGKAYKFADAMLAAREVKP